MTITGPGVYTLDETTYHADTDLAPELGRSLSSSGAKTLTRSTPAVYQWERDHRTSKDSWDTGSVAHALILRNPDRRIRVLDVTDWRTPAIRATRDDLRAAGLVVIHRDMLRAASKMAQAVRRYPTGAAILGHPDRLTEQSIYWTDPATGVTCRGRADIIVPGVAIVDVKTTADASPEGFGRLAYDLCYHMQADWYITGWEAVTGERLPFVWLTVETDPPHLPAAYYATDDQIAAGHELNAEARALFAACESSGEWPGYPPEIAPLTMPAWARIPTADLEETP